MSSKQHFAALKLRIGQGKRPLGPKMASLEATLVYPIVYHLPPARGRAPDQLIQIKKSSLITAC